MVWFKFFNVKRINNKKQAIALLYELGKRGIAGGISFDEENKTLEISFLKPPTSDELNFLKSFLQAEKFEEVDG